MAQNYTRQSTLSDGDTITASLFNDEYNQLVNAFTYSSTSASSTGHRHDGSSGQGGNIFKIGDLDFLNKIEVDSTNNRWGFYVEVSSAAVEQIRIQDGAVVPVTDSDIDLGTTSLRFKDTYTDTITTTGNVSVGGNLTVTGTTTFNGGTLTLGDAADDNVVFGADVNSHIIPNTDDTYDLGSTTQQWRNLYIDGIANIDSLVADTADIDGGTIDGTVIGGTTPAAVSATTVSATGNITVGGTVDGRDVATDGTKLDGIEALADVTDTTNVTAAGALMDSELTNITAVKALDQGVATTDTPTFAGLATSANVTFGDNDKAIFGASSDLQIYHDGVHSYVEDAGTGNLRLKTNGVGLQILDGSDLNLALFNAGSGQSYLYNVNGGVSTQRLATTTTGIDVTGTITFDGGTTTANVNFGDNDKAIFGAGSDLEIYHDSNNSYIKDAGTGNLYINANELRIGNADNSKDYIHGNNGAEVKLYYNNSQKLATTSTGIDVTGVITTDGMTTSADINFGDNDKAVFGAGSDLQIYHDGSTSIIKDAGTGELQLHAENNLRLQNLTGSTYALFSNGAAASLYYNGSAKLATTSTGIDVTGTATTDGLIVDTAIATSTASFRATTNSTTIGQKIGSLDFFNGTTNAAGTLEVRRASGGNAYSDMALMASANGNRSNQLLLSTNGDISFYESTGTTPKFFWDSSAASLGVGTTSPEHSLHVYDAGSTTAGTMKIGGSAASLGLEIAYSQAGNTSASIFANPTYTNDDAVLKIGVDGDRNANHLVLDGTGNVGIGTSSPDTSLHISEPSTATATVRLEQTDTTLVADQAVGVIEFEQNDAAGVGVPAKFGAFAENANAAVGLRFYTGTGATANERMRIDASGNVGIGTNSPAFTTGSGLEIERAGAATLRLEDTGSSGKPFEIYSDDGEGYVVNGIGSGMPMIFKTVNTERMRIDASGNVGIGTSSPGTKLSVVDTSAQAVQLSLQNSGRDWRIGPNSGVGSSSLVFYDNTASQTRLVIDSSGNVGIGTSSPSSPLEVAGGSSYPTTKFSRDGGTAATQGYLTTGFSAIGYSGGTGADSYMVSEHGFGFAVNAGTNALVITDGGNVGIGTSSPAYNLDVSKGSAGTAARFTASTDNGRGLSFISSDNGIFLGAIWTRDVASGSGIHAWSINSTERMRIDSSGNVEIKSGGKLQANRADNARNIQLFNDNDFGTIQTSNDPIKIASQVYTRFDVSGSEAMRIDSSGNLLVSKTANNDSDAGVVLRATGEGSFVASGQRVAYFNRLSSDGEIITLRKDGTSAGSIAVKADTSNNYMIIGKGSVGMQYASDSEANSVLPARPDNQSLRDAGIDLGASGTRFKDLYLSGTATTGDIYVGAGSATSPSVQMNDTNSGLFAPAGNTIAFSTAGGERARIDASGHFYVGKTNNTLSNDGTVIRASGEILTTNTSDIVVNFNRTGTDGSIVQLYKDGLTVGSIGTSGGSAYIGGYQNAGLYFNGTSDVRPWNTSTQANLDNSVDLGNSSSRFKDLYLSGDVIAPNIVASNGVFLGGTAAANKLDDYEEGTFTPTLYGASSAGTTTYATVTGTYTKVGNRCTVNFVCNVTATTGTGSLRLGGLPFTSSGENTTAIMINNLNWGGGTYLMAYVGDNSDFARVYYVGDDNTWQQQQITNEAQHFIFTLSYQTA